MEILEKNREGHFLPKDTILEDRYVIGEVSGEGNFGITYTGWDKLLESRVAIKEFFPVSRVSRRTEEGNFDVFVFQEEDYEEILAKYLEEAKRLSKLNQVEGIVSIRDFFYANNTAYIVMEYIEGTSVKEYVEKRGPMTENEIKEMLKPVLDALEQVHDIGIIHRDISPDNIMITENHKVVLVDFGSARKVDLPEDKSMTVMIKRGYSSPELYRSHGNQGPWTDVYAVCATIYYMLTGHVPDEAIDRILEDETPSLTGMKEVKASLAFKKAVMKGISVNYKERYTDVIQLERDLYTTSRNQDIKSLIAAGILLLGILSVAAIFMWNPDKGENQVYVTKTERATTVTEPTETPSLGYQMISCLGKTKTEILKQLKGIDDNSLQIVWKLAFSNKVKKGKVISQSIPESTYYGVGERQVLTLTVSKGKKKIVVPQLVGMNYVKAKQLLKDKKLKYRILWREENGTDGIVLVQSRKRGAKCSPGTRITLTVRRQKRELPQTQSDSEKQNQYDGIIS